MKERAALESNEKQSGGSSDEAQVLPVQKLTRFGTFKELSKLGLTVAMSYTFSIELVLISLFLYRLSENEAETASVALITTFLSAVLSIGGSPLLILNIPASRHLGALLALSSPPNSSLNYPFPTNTSPADDQLHMEEALPISSTNRKVINNKNDQHEHCDEEEVERGMELEMEVDKEKEREKERGLVEEVFRKGVYEGMGLVPVVMVVLLLSGPMMKMFGQEEEVAEDVEHYFDYYFWSVPMYMSRLILEQMIFAFKRPMPVMMIGLSNLIVCTGLAYCLGYGALGFPHMGFAGISMSYAIESSMTCICDGMYLMKGKPFRDFHFINFRKKVEGAGKMWKEMIKMGMGLTFTTTSQMLTSFATSLFAGLLGNEAQSAWGAGLSYSFFALILMFAFGSMCSLVLAGRIGEKRYEEANRVGVWGLITTMIYVIPIPAFFACYPEGLVWMLDLDEGTASLLPILLPIVSVGVICDAGRYNVMMQMRALNQHRMVVIISFMGMVMGIITSGYLGLQTRMGIYGIAVGYTFISFAGLLALMLPWIRALQPSRIRLLFPPSIDRDDNDCDGDNNDGDDVIDTTTDACSFSACALIIEGAKEIICRKEEGEGGGGEG